MAAELDDDLFESLDGTLYWAIDCIRRAKQGGEGDLERAIQKLEERRLELELLYDDYRGEPDG